jgi:hypothetical protein
VEKLVEEVVKDIHHLRHLIGICEGNFTIHVCYISLVQMFQSLYYPPSWLYHISGKSCS